MSSTSPRPARRLTRLRLASVLAAVLSLAAGGPLLAGSAAAQSGGADLSITVSHVPSSARTGDEVSFTVTASNAGPTTAADVVVGMSLGYTWRHVSTSGTDCGFGGENQSVICALGAVAPGSSVSVTVVAMPLFSGVHVIPAAVASETPDPDAGDRATTDTVLVQQGPSQGERAVAEIYRLVLGREAAPREVAYWGERWNDSEWGQRHRVPLAIIASPESARRRVQATYAELLGRAASEADQAHWVGELTRGLTFESFEASVLGSAEFARHNGPETDLIQHAVYTHVVGRQAASAEIEHWESRLASGVARRDLVAELQRTTEARDRVIARRVREVLERETNNFDRFLWLGAMNRGSTHDEQWALLFTNGEFLEQFPYDYEAPFAE